MNSKAIPAKVVGTWAVGFFAILAVNAVWQALNQMPPAWDMAYHQRMGWSFYEALRDGASFSTLIHLSDYYPPLYYLVEALFFALFGPTCWLPFLANLPGLVLLSYFSFRLAWSSAESRWAPLAGHLVLMLPLLAWTSRESLLDPSLSGLLALALFLLLRSDCFLERKWTLGFGLSVAAGLLLKWTFIAFVVPGVLYCLWRSPRRPLSLRNLLDAVLVAMPPAFLWYLPNLNSLIERFRLTTAGAGWEQDPEVWSLLGWVYYPRCLAGYYLFLPLTVAFLWAVWRLAAAYRAGNTRTASELVSSRVLTGIVTVTLVGGLLLLGLLKAKDPRYAMPFVVPLVLILYQGFVDRPRAFQLVAGWASLQFLLISFAVPLDPGKIALFALDPDPDFVGMRQEWVWFESNYFGVVGPPRRENWHYADILGHLSSGDQVGFVPDATFFHPGALELKAAERGIELTVFRLGITEGWPDRLKKTDWVVGKSGSQGISYITLYNRDVYAALETLNWPRVDTWELPDGSQAMIWRNPSRSQ